MIIMRRTKTGIVLPEDALERSVQHGGPDVEDMAPRGERGARRRLLPLPLRAGASASEFKARGGHQQRETETASASQIVQ